MTVVLDAGGVSALAGRRERLLRLRERRSWPPELPCVVLVEALTGSHRRDFVTNRLLRDCLIFDVDETLTREAARLRKATGRAGSISAVDSIVAAFASSRDNAVVWTSDPRDLGALSRQAAVPFGVFAV